MELYENLSESIASSFTEEVTLENSKKDHTHALKDGGKISSIKKENEERTNAVSPFPHEFIDQSR